ncbi:nucleotidyltransferase [Aphanothece hegewaldii CCALA 016]|uniref:Nucleotidyltransferase n=1 Tax=Aphanothece hegewaldii CCALA 016 TaxID=2107694 RepID=A0A2T1M3J1_9CHRO|nr:nucleotidyltransferase family protein [Aphanothece hegewaldii]PSF39320.1 nucleotidyltransferase [Aphanothece hegewaldii CCALA 016]
MELEKVLLIVTEHQDTLRRLGVKSLDLFGSVARNQATVTSDVDFMVEFSNDAGFFELIQLKYYLEDILGCKVDLGTKDSLREPLKESVMKDTICVI